MIISARPLGRSGRSSQLTLERDFLISRAVSGGNEDMPRGLIGLDTKLCARRTRLEHEMSAPQPVAQVIQQGLALMMPALPPQPRELN
jgi:hypothetical protein